MKNFPGIKGRIVKIFNAENRLSNGFSAPALLLIGLNLTIRFVYLISNPDKWINADSGSYLFMADSIINGKPVPFFPNGYPLILAFIKLIAGEHSVIVSAVFNFVLSAGLIAMVYRLIRIKYDVSIALGGAAIFSFIPNQIQLSNDLLSEVPATFLLVVSFYLLMKNREILSGAALYAACMIRTSLTPVILLILFDLVFLKKDKMKALKYLAGFTAIVIAEYLMVYGGLIVYPENQNINLLIAINHKPFGMINYDPGVFPHELRADPLMTYLNYIITNPADYLLLRIQSLYDLWGPVPYRKYPTTLLYFYAYSQYLLRTVLFITFIISVKKRLKEDFFRRMTYPVIVITLVHFFYFSGARFNYPLEPFLVAGSIPAFLSIRDLILQKLRKGD
ncbi:MAG: hypothetical protein L6Q59_04975 [Ignavibacteriaceae bacterium]|nr:hypothetical protein [Ignavibacteriaceae bacterium]